MSQAIETVQGIYAAFGRGDVPALLASLADDVEWEYGQPPTPVPWLRPLRGRDQVPRFFEALLGAVEMNRFEPTRLLADGDLVTALCQVEFTVRASGRRVVERDEVHLWHFDPAGKVSRFRHRADSWQHAMAGRGGAPADHVLNVLGDRVQVLADHQTTDGGYEQFLLKVEADRGPPLHRHAWEETYCVLEGEIELDADGTRRRLGQGAYARVPGRRTHTYRGVSPRARVLVTTVGQGSPSLFFAALDAVAPSGGCESAQVMEIARGFGVDAGEAAAVEGLRAPAQP